MGTSDPTMKSQLLILSVALLWVLFLTGADGQCTFNYNIQNSARMTSPNYPDESPSYRCRYTTLRFTAPAGSTFTLSCRGYKVDCRNRFWFSPPTASTCGGSFTPRTTSSNVLVVTIYYNPIRYWWWITRKPLKFDCTAIVNSNGATPTTTTTTTTTTPDPTTRCDCGEAIIRTDPRIVGGQDATYGEYPYQARIMSGLSAFCGGSLISADFIVSAAHCGITTRHTARLGDHRQNQADFGEITVTFAQIIRHPQYRSNPTIYDVALVRLTRPVTFTNYIKPICLPDPFTSTSFTGTPLRATGWGRLASNGLVPNYLQEVNVNGISNTQCRNIYGSSAILNNMICAERPGRDTCQGDSGGPLAYDQNKNRWYLIGLTSFGIGCASPGVPGVYTRVSDAQILSWIKTNAGITCVA